MAATVSLDANAIHNSDGTFDITGRVSSTSGLKEITISDSIENGRKGPAGTAFVNADGTFSFLDRLSGLMRSEYSAAAFYSDGTIVQSAVAPYTLYADGHETTVDGSGGLATSTTFKNDGSSTTTITAGGLALQSNFFDTFKNGGAPDNTFVFGQNHGLDIVQQFRVNGADHDILSFTSSDFGNDLAQLLAHTYQVKGVGAVIRDPTTGDTVRLGGISKAALVHNQADITFHP